jgi:aminocarboxymuconate-semialdehyde decarboxylase
MRGAACHICAMHLPDDPLLLAKRMYYDDLVYDSATIHRPIEVFGASQVMAGTDYPFAIMDDDPAGRIASLQLTPEATQQLRSSTG